MIWVFPDQQSAETASLIILVSGSRTISLRLGLPLNDQKIISAGIKDGKLSPVYWQKWSQVFPVKNGWAIADPSNWILAGTVPMWELNMTDTPDLVSETFGLPRLGFPDPDKEQTHTGGEWILAVLNAAGLTWQVEEEEEESYL